MRHKPKLFSPLAAGQGLSPAQVHTNSRGCVSRPALRLMPLGGSITYGVGSSDGNGYRQFLREILVSKGYAVDVVGSRRAGCPEHCYHEGWRGFRIDQIATRARKSVPELAPTLFTINAGSNDCIQDFEIDRAGERMSEILEFIWSAIPRSAVLLSTLVTNADPAVESRVLRLNEQFRMLVRQKAAQQRKIVLVEMHSPSGPLVGDLMDGTHPNDVGYHKMANIWCQGIDEAASKGFLDDL